MGSLPLDNTVKEEAPSHSALTQKEGESNIGAGEKSLVPSTAPGTGDERPDTDFQRI